MSTPKLEAPEWFFMWSTGKPYITMICAWTRRALISEVEKAHAAPWKHIYKQGGRAIRCRVTPKMRHNAAGERNGR